MGSLYRVLGIAITCLAIAVAPAQALVGGSPANRDEAGWAVHIYMYAGQSRAECSGTVIRTGLVLTAGHCASVGGYRCGAPYLAPTMIRLKFAHRAVRITRNAAARVTRHPQWVDRSCDPNPNTGRQGKLPLNDVAVIRYNSPGREPTIPLASAAEIASMVNRGVTLFGGGFYPVGPSRYRLSSWIRKSRDGAFFELPYCQVEGGICFRPANPRFTSAGGDSGGAWAGWLGGWKELAVVSGTFYEDVVGTFPNVGVSMADPVVRGWIDQQIATP